jgi:hypothetical protein
VEGFRPNPKMKSQIACFKEGGSTTPAKKEAKCHDKKDVAEDKKIAKKAVAQHEGAKHKGEEKTELKLKEGGRSKKKEGNVKRYDSKAIKMKKDESDKKAIAKVKKTKPVVERMSPAPAAPAPKGMGMPMEDTSDMNMGVQSFADGGMPADLPAPGMMAPYMPQQPQELVRRGGNRMPQGRTTPRNKPAMPPRGFQNPLGIMRPMNGAPMGNLEALGAGMTPGMEAPMGNLEALGAGMSAMGGANTGMGAISDAERAAIMQGLQAVGNYCAGGKA